MKYENGIYDTILSEHLEEQKRVPETKMILCIDGYQYYKIIMHDNAFNEILFNGRHFGITLIMTVQYYGEIPSPIKKYFNYVFAFGDNNESNKQNLYIRYFDKLKPYENFRTIFDNINNN